MAVDKEPFDLDTAVLSKAVDVFGSKEEAENWLLSPALGLNGERPIDLLRSPEGKVLVQELLGRLEHGVYT